MEGDAGGWREKCDWYEKWILKKSWRIYFPHSMSPSHASPRSKNVTLEGKSIESLLWKFNVVSSRTNSLASILELQQKSSCILPSSCPHLLWISQTIPFEPPPFTSCCIPALNSCRHLLLHHTSLLPENQSPNLQHQQTFFVNTSHEQDSKAGITISSPSKIK